MEELSTYPVGFFDSGVGGVSVWREAVKLLPAEHTVYYADSAHCPYGSKSAAEIRARCGCVMDLLLGQLQCKLVVVACNTATAAAIDYLRAAYPVPFVGMEPAVKPAALHSQSGVVGVLATRGTLRGQLYHDTAARFAAQVQMVEQAGDGLVELVEAGRADSEEAAALLRSYIEPMLAAGIDHLVLGCTHYPFLVPAIRKITANRVTIVDPAPAVAARVKYLLEQHGLCNMSGETPRREFFSSGSLQALKRMVPQALSSLPSGRNRQSQ